MEGLTGIRGFAALAVVFYHYQAWFLEGDITTHGYLGVDLFFILSGFVISHSHNRDFPPLTPRNILTFYGLRLARLYPVHVLTLLGMLLIYVVGTHLGFTPKYSHQFEPSSFVANLLLIHAWGASWPLTWNFPAWSISCEWFAYLLFPFLRTIGLRLRVPAIAWMVIPYVALVWAFFFLYGRDMNQNDGINALLRVVLEFIMGMGLYQLFRARSWAGMWPLPVCSFMVLWFVPDGLYEPLMILVFLAAILVAADQNESSPLLSRPLVYLGEISYSIYMTHIPIVMSLGKGGTYLISHGWNRFLVMMGMVVIVLASASLTYHMIEVPCRNRIRRALKTRLRPKGLRQRRWNPQMQD